MTSIYEERSNKTLNETLDSLKRNLNENNFGVLWELNFKEKLAEKNLEIKDDFIMLEVCNPKLAKEFFDENARSGYVLPCKMVVRSENNITYIGITSPQVILGLLETPSLDDLAKKTEELLKGIIKLSL